MKKTRFLSLALTGTLCVSLLAGCGGSGDDGGAAQTPDAANTSAVQENTGSAFKLGGTGPLTGDAAIYGLAAQRGAQIAVDEIKEAGGDIQFTLKYEDDVSVPETAVNAYNALKEWGMQISLGSVTSQPGVSTSALAFEDRIFTMTPSGSSPDVISGKDNVYQMCFSDPNQGLASAQYITEQGLGEKVFIIWKSDDNYSTGIKDKFVAEAETLGLNVVGNATFTADSKNDFTVQLTQAKQAGADLPKLAVMPQSRADVLELLAATAEMVDHHPETPVITMSMGALGAVSRLCGEAFGSAMTFGAVGQVSAPGQIPVEELNAAMDILHRALAPRS